MMFLVDTNVLVYATNEQIPEHEACHALVERWRSTEPAWFTTWNVLYEYLRVVTHPKVHRRPWSVDRALGFVESLLASPGLTVLTATERHAELLARTLREIEGLGGSVLHDVHTVVLMREHGIRRIVTRDGGFRRFPFLEVVDPLDDELPDAVHERSPGWKRRARRSSRVRA